MGQVILSVTQLNAVGWTLTSIAIALTLGRFWRRRYKKTRLGWDDVLNAVAAMFLLLFTITYQLYVPGQYEAELYALGRTDKVPPPYNADRANRLDAVNVVAYFGTIYSVKASFLALYRRIFETSKKFRTAWWLVAVFTGLSFLISFLALFWECGEPRHFLKAEVCQTTPLYVRNNIVTLFCVFNAVSDLLIMILPTTMLRKLNMPLSQKFGLGFVFSLALITIAFNILRTVKTIYALFPAENALWTLLEPTIAVIVCTLPCYRAYLIWLSPTMFSTMFHSLSELFTSRGEDRLNSENHSWNSISEEKSTASMHIHDARP